MTQYVHRTIIVPAEYQALAQALCEAAAEGDAGKGMFTTGLSATGEQPATHYISAGHIFQEFADLLPLTTIATDGETAVETTRPGDAQAVEGLAAQFGVTVPDGAIAALLDAVDVSEQGPWEAMARLGLQIAQEAP